MLADSHPLLYIPPQSVGKNGGKMLTAQQTKHLAKSAATTTVEAST